MRFSRLKFALLAALLTCVAAAQPSPAAAAPKQPAVVNPVWEHRLVSGSDLSKLSVAFLNANGVVSVLYFVTILVALAL